jgi:hypothetical protein
VVVKQFDEALQQRMRGGARALGIMSKVAKVCERALWL